MFKLKGKEERLREKQLNIQNKIEIQKLQRELHPHTHKQKSQNEMTAAERKAAYWDRIRNIGS